MTYFLAFLTGSALKPFSMFPEMRARGWQDLMQYQVYLTIFLLLENSFQFGSMEENPQMALRRKRFEGTQEDDSASLPLNLAAMLSENDRNERK